MPRKGCVLNISRIARDQKRPLTPQELYTKRIGFISELSAVREAFLRY